VFQQKIETAGGLRLILSPLILPRSAGKPTLEAMRRTINAVRKRCTDMLQRVARAGPQHSPQ